MTQVDMTHGEWLEMQKKKESIEGIRKFKDKHPYPISLVQDAKYLMDILSAAKLRNSDSELGERYEIAIASVGKYYLDMIESLYAPIKKSYRVHLKGERIIEVMASSEEEAEQMVCQGDEILDWERTDEVEEIEQ